MSPIGKGGIEGGCRMHDAGCTMQDVSCIFDGSSFFHLISFSNLISTVSTPFKNLLGINRPSFLTATLILTPPSYCKLCNIPQRKSLLIKVSESQALAILCNPLPDCVMDYIVLKTLDFIKTKFL